MNRARMMPTGTVRIQNKNKLSAAARREENWGWIMVAPTIIGLAVLNLWPFVQTVYASFCALDFHLRREALLMYWTAWSNWS